LELVLELVSESESELVLVLVQELELPLEQELGLVSAWVSQSAPASQSELV
jgi:hypothetical protein